MIPVCEAALAVAAAGLPRMADETPELASARPAARSLAGVLEREWGVS